MKNTLPYLCLASLFAMVIIASSQTATAEDPEPACAKLIAIVQEAEITTVEIVDEEAEQTREIVAYPEVLQAFMDTKQMTTEAALLCLAEFALNSESKKDACAAIVLGSVIADNTYSALDMYKRGPEGVDVPMVEGTDLTFRKQYCRSLRDAAARIAEEAAAAAAAAEPAD